MNKKLKKAIIEAVQMEYECGHFADIDEIKSFVNECGLVKNKKEKEEAMSFYEELQQLGPVGMLEEYPDLDWDEYFLQEYGEEDDEYDEEDDEDEYDETEEEE